MKVSNQSYTKEIFYKLSNIYTLYHYKCRKITFCLNKDSNQLEFVIIGTPPKDSPATVFRSLYATHDRTLFCSNKSTLFIDAHAMTGILTWAITRKKFSSNSAIKKYVDNLFSPGDALILHEVLLTALSASLDLNVPGDLDYRKHRAFNLYPLNFMNLQNGGNEVIGEIVLPDCN